MVPVNALRLPGALLSMLWVTLIPPVSALGAETPTPIAAALQPWVDQGRISGAVGLVADRDRVVTVESAGVSDLSTRRPMRSDDLFWIASMTKPMTAVCVLMLADAGTLRLDDPVETYLPEFHGQWLLTEDSPERRVLSRPARAVTVRDLLTHTSGLTGDVPQRPDASLAQTVSATAREPLQFPPGSRWSYSNPGINTLGRLVEVVSGLSFPDFLQQRVLNPLGMKNTTFWPTASQEKRLAKSYKAGPEGDLKEVTVFFADGRPLGDRSRTPKPAGGLFSTASDMARFYQMMLQGGTYRGRRLLSENAVAEMTRTQTGPLKTGFVDGMSWGLGFQVVKHPQGVTAMLSPGTFGHGGAYGTQSWADPVTGRIYILMIQAAGLPNADASEIRSAFQAAAAAMPIR